MPTYNMTFYDLDVITKIEVDWNQGAVYLTVNDTTVKIPIETFYKITEIFPVLADGGYT